MREARRLTALIDVEFVSNYILSLERETVTMNVVGYTRQN